MSMFPLYHVIDFETTQSRDGFRAVELAIVSVGEEGVLGTTTHLVDPGCPIDPYSQAVHGISNGMVRGKPRLPELWGQLQPLLHGSILLAHNATFDAGVLRDEIRRHNLPQPTIKWLCSYRLAKRVWPSLKCHKLGYLCDHFALHGENSHRAEADALLTVNLVKRAVSELTAKQPGTPWIQCLCKGGEIKLKASWPF